MKEQQPQRNLDAPRNSNGRKIIFPKAEQILQQYIIVKQSQQQQRKGRREGGMVQQHTCGEVCTGSCHQPLLTTISFPCANAKHPKKVFSHNHLAIFTLTTPSQPKHSGTPTKITNTRKYQIYTYFY